MVIANWKYIQTVCGKRCSKEPMASDDFSSNMNEDKTRAIHEPMTFLGKKATSDSQYIYNALHGNVCLSFFFFLYLDKFTLSDYGGSDGDTHTSWSFVFFLLLLSSQVFFCVRECVCRCRCHIKIHMFRCAFFGCFLSFIFFSCHVYF